MIEEQLAKIRQQRDRMDDAFWDDKVSAMTLAREHFGLDPNPVTELAAEKAILDFEIAEIRYNGYTEILDYPERAAKITERVIKEIEEKQKTLKLLEEGYE